VRLNKSQLGPKIKLDVGGTIFATSLTTLTLKDSYFVSMFSGRWELKPQEDGSYFIDRDPFVFRHILNFLRDGQIDLEVLTKAELKALTVEAKFYLLQPLIDLLEPQLFPIQICTTTSNTLPLQFLPASPYTLSKNNKCATLFTNANTVVSIFGNIKVSSGSHSWKVKILKMTTSIMVGVVPSDADNMKVLYNTKGWYFHCFDSTLYSTSPTNSNKAYSKTGRLADRSIVTVNLNVDSKTISYIINGTNYGVAFNGIASDATMNLCVSIWVIGDSVEIVE